MHLVRTPWWLKTVTKKDVQHMACGKRNGEEGDRARYNPKDMPVVTCYFLQPIAISAALPPPSSVFIH
jgi:hypothetical protein